MSLRLLRKDQKGIAIIYLALVIFVVFAFVGFGVDVGYVHVAKGQLQNAADAAALAGAAKMNPNLPIQQQYSARGYAQTFASSNRAAQSPVIVASTASDNTLSNATASGGNDITFGRWTQASGYQEGTTPINAIRVRARRSVPGATPENQGQIAIFFAKVIGWNFMSTSAEAVATIVPAKLLPIMVNEYWLGDYDHAKQKPYGANQQYPNSFTRITNVDGTPSLVFGKTFAILGSDANDNVPNNVAKGSKSMNGFVNLDARSPRHDAVGNSWYAVNTLAPSATCSNCMGLFGPAGAYDPNSGDINSQKFNDSIGYLFDGYTFLPPSTVPEPVRASPGVKGDPYLYPDSTNVYNTSPYDPSNCPFATVAYFSASGKAPLNKQSSTGLSFMAAYPIGKKIVALVYDGTFIPYADPSAPNAVTTVGYTLLQIDGYGSDITKLGTSGNTMFAHAVTDMIMPGDCSSASFDQIRQLQNLGATAQLVR